MSKLCRLRGLLINCISAETLSASNLNLTAWPVMDRGGWPRFLCDHNTAILGLKAYYKTKFISTLKSFPSGYVKKTIHIYSRAKAEPRSNEQTIGEGAQERRQKDKPRFLSLPSLFLSRAPSIPHPSRFTVSVRSYISSFTKHITKNTPKKGLFDVGY